MTDRRQGFTPLFVGADELVAVLDRSHPRHVELADLWRLFLEPDTVLVTTDWSVVKASLAVERLSGP